MSKVGYARVSSVGQSLDVQLEKLRCCDKVFQEKRSGVTADRPELANCLNYVRDGDVLVITKLDRLARSTFHLTQIAHDLEQKGVALQVIDQNIDTTTPTGRLMFNILATIAEFETEIRKERQLEGIKKAKENGVRFGRKAKLSGADIEAIFEKRENGELISSLMKEYNISKATVYRSLTLKRNAK